MTPLVGVEKLVIIVVLSEDDDFIFFYGVVTRRMIFSPEQEVLGAFQRGLRSFQGRVDRDPKSFKF